MAVLYISEYAQGAALSGRLLPVGQEPVVSEQTVAIGGASTQSTALKNNTVLVRLHTDAICSVAFGTNPTATATTKRLAANQTEYFEVLPASSLKVAVITNT